MSARVVLPAIQVDLKVQDLQRRIRALEHDRRAYKEEAQMLIRNQRAAIDKISRENRVMKLEREYLSRSSLTVVEHKTQEELASEIESGIKSLEDKLILETERKLALEDSVGAVTSELTTVRVELAKNGGKPAVSEAKSAQERRVVLLEDRLHSQVQQFNLAAVKNRELRGKIDKLRRENIIMERTQGKLIKEMSLRKQQMSNIIDQANASFAAREQATNDMFSLKIQAEKESAELDKEWGQLAALLEADRLMRSPVGCKDMGVVEEGLRKRRQAPKMVAESQNTKTNTAGSLAQYESAFERIREATGFTDIDSLVDTFESSNQASFSFYRHASERAAELDKLEKKKASLSAEIEGLITRTSSDVHVEQLQAKLATIEQANSKLDMASKSAVESINRLRISAQSIYDAAGLPKDPKVKEPNPLKLLAKVETKVLKMGMTFAILRGLEPTVSGKKGQRKVPRMKLPSAVEYDGPEDANEKVASVRGMRLNMGLSAM